MKSQLTKTTVVVVGCTAESESGSPETAVEDQGADAMIKVWTGPEGNKLVETRRGNNLQYAAKRVAQDYDAEVIRVDDVIALLRTEYGHTIMVELYPDWLRR